MSRLIPCSSCRRHVKRTEGVCPFCAAPLPSTSLDLPAARPVPPGTKRAALFAMGISLAASACEADNSVPVYGAPNVPLGGSSGASGSGGNGSGGNGNPGGGGGSGGNGPSGAGAGGAAAGAGGTEVTDAGDAGDATSADATAPDADTDPGDPDAAP